MKKQNKILVVLMSLFLIAGLSSCKKETTSDPAPTLEERISGDTWFLGEINQYDSAGNLTGSTSTNDSIQFYANGLARLVYSSGTEELAPYEVYELDGENYIEFYGTVYLIRELTDSDMIWRRSFSGGYNEFVFSR